MLTTFLIIVNVMFLCLFVAAALSKKPDCVRRGSFDEYMVPMLRRIDALEKGVKDESYQAERAKQWAGHTNQVMTGILDHLGLTWKRESEPDPTYKAPEPEPMVMRDVLRVVPKEKVSRAPKK